MKASRLQRKSSGPCFSAAPPAGIPVREIIAATGMSRRWVFYRLQQMAAAGLAVQWYAATGGPRRDYP